MRPTERGAGGERHTRRAAEEEQTAAIIRLAPRIGNCINCGQHIRLTGGATTCPTCRAWQRWYSAFRVASAALREAQR